MRYLFAVFFVRFFSRISFISIPFFFCCSSVLSDNVDLMLIACVILWGWRRCHFSKRKIVLVNTDNCMLHSITQWSYRFVLGSLLVCVCDVSLRWNVSNCNRLWNFRRRRWKLQLKYLIVIKIKMRTSNFQLSCVSVCLLNECVWFHDDSWDSLPMWKTQQLSSTQKAISMSFERKLQFSWFYFIEIWKCNLHKHSICMIFNVKKENSSFPRLYSLRLLQICDEVCSCNMPFMWVICIVIHI